MLVQVAAGIRSLLCGITLYRAPAGCMPPRAAVEIGERSGVTNGSGARLDSTERAGPRRRGKIGGVSAPRPGNRPLRGASGHAQPLSTRSGHRVEPARLMIKITLSPISNPAQARSAWPHRRVRPRACETSAEPGVGGTVRPTIPSRYGLGAYHRFLPA